MDAHDRSSDACTHADPLGGLRNAPQHTPHKRAVSLPRHPGMKMIGDQEKLKANTFSHLSMGDQVAWFMFLAGKGVS
jgi:hypothetical protein